ncbi:MAG TPA: hypothetical protein VF297_15975 [Pyrinomonadaceae bacterium]
MRRALFISLGLAFLLAAACAAAEPTARGPASTGDVLMSDQVELDYSLGYRGDKSLELTYAVVNHLKVDVYLFTPLSEFRDQDWEPAPNRVYAHVDEGGVLQLSKMLWPVPEDVDVYMPEVPYLTRVAPGAKFSEVILIRVPVRTDLPYLFDDDEDDDEPKKGGALTTVDAVVFSIGYVAPDKSPDELGLKKDATGKLFSIDYGPGVVNQKIVNGKKTAIKVSVYR